MNPEKTNHNLIEVVEFCRQRNLPADVVGRWVWIAFSEKPSAEVRAELKSFGFRWVPRRGQWAHNCGHPSKPSPRNPRTKYAVVPVAQFDDAA